MHGCVRPVVLAIALASLAGTAEAAESPATPDCSFGVFTTHAYRPSGSGPAQEVRDDQPATVCEEATGAPGTEPILASTSNGTLFLGMVTAKGLHADPGQLHGKHDVALLRSRDNGRSWQRIQLPSAISASEGMPYVDRATDRLFVSSFSIDLTRCGQPVVFSDDEGDHWQSASRRPGCSPPTLGDWPKLFTGPFKGRQAPNSFPHAVYLCNFIPNLLVAASSGCWRSDDGGAHFGFAGFLPTVNGLCRAGGKQSGIGATIVHGTGQVLANGDVIVPVTVCGVPMALRSTNEAKTWTAHPTGGRSLGLRDVLTGREGLVLAINDHVWSENLAQDEHGNLFFAYLSDGGVRLDVSRDGGLSWTQLGIVTPPGLRRQVAVSITARGTGEVALTFYATPDDGDPLSARGMRWQAWMTHSADALARNPVFRSAPTSSLAQPTMWPSMPGCCTTAQTFLEYTGVRFIGRTTIGGVFTRWTTEPTIKALALGVPDLVFTRMDVSAGR